MKAVVCYVALAMCSSAFSQPQSGPDVPGPGMTGRASTAIPVSPGRGQPGATDAIDPRAPRFRATTEDAPVRATDADQRLPAQQIPVLGLGKDYKVGPNDLLDIEIPDLDSQKRTVRVNAAGAISLPLVGSVVVGGLSAHDVEQRIAARYREKYLQNPSVSVFVKEFTTERITVEGAVVKPGIYPLTGQITLLRALALAGGFGQIADSNEVMLFRVNEGVRQVAVFDVDKIRAGKADDPAIRGDDLIVVQRDSSRRVLKDSLFRDILDSINPFSAFSR